MRKKTPEPEVKKPIAWKYQLKPGVWVIDVPVHDPDNSYATVRLSTWSNLLNLGMSPLLRVNSSRHIDAWCPHVRRYVRLARLIANCNSDQEVRLKDGNECNLLEDNLIVIDRDPVIWDREKYLNAAESGTFHDDIETKTKPVDQPKIYEDPLAGAWSRNTHIQKGMQFN